MDRKSIRTDAIRKLFLLPVVFIIAAINCNSVNPSQPVTTTGGDIRAFCISGPYLFAGTYDGGIFRSTNNGESWTAVNTGLTTSPGRPGPCVLSFAVSGNNIFAGTGYGQGMFLSTNNGESWTAVNSGLPLNSPITIECTAPLIVRGDSIFTGTGCSGIFLSTNNGKSWTDVSSGLTTHVTSGLNPEYTFKSGIMSFAECGADLFASTNDGVFRLTHDDNGFIKWTSVSSGLVNEGWGISLAVNGNNIFAGCGSGGVFLSTNNGTSWTPVNSGLTNGPVMSVFVSGSRLFAGTYGDGDVFLSTNNGNSWTAIKSDLSNYMYALTFFTSGSTIFAGTMNGGVFRSTDNGETWTAVNSGLNARWSYE